MPQFISFEVKSFGEYSVPSGTDAAAIREKLQEHLRLSSRMCKDLYANGIPVDSRATAGTWPLTSGARLEFSEDLKRSDPLLTLSSFHAGVSMIGAPLSGASPSDSRLQLVKRAPLSELGTYRIKVNVSRGLLRAPIIQVVSGRIRVLRSVRGPQLAPVVIPELREVEARSSGRRVRGHNQDRSHRGSAGDGRVTERSRSSLKDFVSAGKTRAWASLRLAGGRLKVSDGLVVRSRSGELGPVYIELRAPLPIDAFKRYAADCVEQVAEFGAGDPAAASAGAGTGSGAGAVDGALVRRSGEGGPQGQNGRGRSARIRQAASSQPERSVLAPVLSALIPLFLSAGLAFALKQPMFLLFALTGPLLAFTQLFLRKAPLPQDLNYHVFPQWLRRGVHCMSLEDALTVREVGVRLGIPAPLPPVPSAQCGDFQVPVSTSRAAVLVCRALGFGVAPGGAVELVVPRAIASGWLWLRWLRPTVSLYDEPEGLLPLLRSRSQGTGLSPAALTVVVGVRGAVSVFAPSTPWDVRRVTESLQAPFVQDGMPTSGVRHGGGALGSGEVPGSSVSTVLEAAEAVSRICSASFTERGEAQGVPSSALAAPASVISGVPVKWDRNAWDSCEIVFGVDSSGDVAIDLARLGPHMLVAGTTGSGKSEFLLSSLLSAAQRYSPAELNLVLIDYKGGAGLARANELHHSVGMVTDLDATEATRALHGIRAELTRRERVLANSGSSHFAQHNSACAPTDTLPRLLIVVDEFRALSDELPDFISKLVRLAAQGRSLGMHLVLATQRPSGAISPEMRANISLRVCLRVADEQDSLDVVGVTSGADISPELPGRMLVRSGSTPVIALQSLYAGSRSGQTSFLRRLTSWHQDQVIHSLPDTDVALDLFSALSTPEVRERYAPTRKLWAPALPADFSAAPQVFSALCAANERVTLEPRRWYNAHDHRTALGERAETTRNASLLGPGYAREPNTLCAPPSSVLVIGPPQRGKTTALASLALQCQLGSELASSADAQVGLSVVSSTHVAHAPVMDDPAGVVAQTATAAAASAQITGNSREELRTIHWIGSPADFDSIVGTFAQDPCTRLANLIDAGDAFRVHALLGMLASTGSKGIDSPGNAATLIIDDFDVVRATLEAFDRGSGIALLEQVIREASASVLGVAASASRLPPTQFMSLFTQRVVLSSGSKESDALHGVPRDMLPLPAIVGRGVWITPDATDSCQMRNSLANARHLPEGLALNQTALAPAKSLDQLSTAKAALLAHQDRVWSLGELPPLPSPGVLVGFRPRLLESQQHKALIVVGARRSGRSTCLDTLKEELMSSGYLVHRIAGRTPEVEDQVRELIEQLGTQTQRKVAVQCDDLEILESKHSSLATDLLAAAQSAQAVVQASCTTAALGSAFRGALSELREHECVLLLDPRAQRDRDVCAVPITRAIDGNAFAGKAVFVHEGAAQPARVDALLQV